MKITDSRIATIVSLDKLKETEVFETADEEIRMVLDPDCGLDCQGDSMPEHAYCFNLTRKCF